MVDVHGALDGGRAQMQGTDVAQLGDMGFGQGMAKEAGTAEWVGHAGLSGAV